MALLQTGTKTLLAWLRGSCGVRAKSSASEACGLESVLLLDVEVHHVLVVVQERGDVYLSELVDESRYVRNVLVFVAEVDILVIDPTVARVTRDATCPSLILGPPQSIEAAFGVDVIVEGVLPGGREVTERPMATLGPSVLRHLVEHELELLVLLFNLALVEVLDRFSWRTELYQNDGGLLDGDVPVVLELEHVLPDRKTDEFRVPLEELQVARDLDLREVVAEATNGAENIEAAGLRLRLLRAEQVDHHGYH